MWVLLEDQWQLKKCSYFTVNILKFWYLDDFSAIGLGFCEIQYDNSKDYQVNHTRKTFRFKL